LSDQPELVIGFGGQRRWLPADYQRASYKEARNLCKERSGGVCQMCGMAQGSESHHWTYPDPEDITAYHLIWVCVQCHDLTTTVRRVVRDGHWPFLVVMRKVQAMLKELLVQTYQGGVRRNGVRCPEQPRPERPGVERKGLLPTKGPSFPKEPRPARAGVDRGKPLK